MCVMWHQTFRPIQQWNVHSPSERLDREFQLSPIYFQNASVLWLDLIRDDVDIEIARNPGFESVEIDKMQMEVYEDGFRSKVAEIYDIDLSYVDDPITSIYNFEQEDVHLSPFRKLVVYPKMDLHFGSTGWVPSERRGKFIDGVWQEGQDMETSVGLTLVAWLMGLIFLVVGRRRRGRKMRIIMDDKKGIHNKEITINL